jgi:hypothetical protein
MTHSARVLLMVLAGFALGHAKKPEAVKALAARAAPTQHDPDVRPDAGAPARDNSR